MGKVKQTSIDNEEVTKDTTENKKFIGVTGRGGRGLRAPDISAMHPETDVKKAFDSGTGKVLKIKPFHRVYMVDGAEVPSDIFIGKVATALYNHTSDNNFRETIDILCEDLDGREMLTIGGHNFFSFRKDHDPKYIGELILITANNTKVYLDEKERHTDFGKEQIKRIDDWRKEGLTDDQIVEKLGFGGDNPFGYYGLLRRVMDVKHAGPFPFNDEPKEFPKKSYDVYYDVTVIPTVPLLRKKKFWKRTQETVEASSFREAKDLVREKFKKDEQKRQIKNLYVVESVKHNGVGDTDGDTNE